MRHPWIVGATLLAACADPYVGEWALSPYTDEVEEGNVCRFEGSMDITEAMYVTLDLDFACTEGDGNGAMQGDMAGTGDTRTLSLTSYITNETFLMQCTLASSADLSCSDSVGTLRFSR